MVNFSDAVMLNDTKFWKALRKSWYNLLIEGIMKDYDAKKKLAQSFIRHYEQLMDDFVNDDQVWNLFETCTGLKLCNRSPTICSFARQEDDFTITNMSLQFFTVPTIAHDLLRHDNALGVLVEFFVKHFDEQYDGEELVLENWMDGQHPEFQRTKVAIGMGI